MSGVVSRWPALIAATVDPTDVDGEGRLTGAAVERLFGLARTAYFDLCTTVDDGSLDVSACTVVPGVPVACGGVTVSVAVVEIYADRFTMEACVRPAAGEGIAARAKCSLSTEHDVTGENRDEFIALAHAAQHLH